MLRTLLLFGILSLTAFGQGKQARPKLVIESFKDGAIRAHLIAVDGKIGYSFTAACETKAVDAIQSVVQAPKECRLGEDFVGSEIEYAESGSNQDGKIRFQTANRIFVLMQEKSGVWFVNIFREQR